MDNRDNCCDKITDKSNLNIDDLLKENIRLNKLLLEKEQFRQNLHKKVTGSNVGSSQLLYRIDITEHKRVEELEKEIAEKTIKAMELITGAIAHEIRTPLSVINMAVDVLNNELTEDADIGDIISQGKKSIEQIKHAVKTATHIVSMLLVKLRYVFEQEVEKDTFDICSASISINDTLATYPYKGDEASLVEWDQELSHDFYYRGSEALTKHVLFNLMKNSFQAIKEADKGKIHISLKLEKKFNYLIFKDTASGIKAEHLSKLFDTFESNKKEGTGLGLAFCKMVMQSYGGDITCNSKEGEYTEFVLSFPLVNITI